MGAEKRIGLVPRGSRVMSPDGDWGTQQQIRPSGSSFIQARLSQCHELTDHSHGAVGVRCHNSARLLFGGRLDSGIYFDAILEHEDVFARSLIEYLCLLPHGRANLVGESESAVEYGE
jgi:hypothetical protein